MNIPLDQNLNWSLVDWLVYLESQHSVETSLGLKRICKVAARMELGKLPMPVITTAGTNGKGSTCRFIEQLLTQAGYHTGVYCSPHLLDYRERVRIDGRSPHSNFFCDAFRAIETARENIQLTYFEFSTLAALWLFKQSRPDFVILEVGLGGRFDATNIIDAEVAIVTTVSLDHVEYLGSDLMEIGREKAGIFRTNGKAVIGDLAIVSSVVEIARALHCDLLQNGFEIMAEQEDTSWNYLGRSVRYHNLNYPMLPLDNAVAALAATEHLGISLNSSQVREALSNWALVGRMQKIRNCPAVYLDVAHNPQSAEYLAQQLNRIPCEGRCWAVCAMTSDKDNQASVDALKNNFDQWLIAGLSGPRGDNGDKLAKALCNQPMLRYNSVVEAYQAALLEAEPEDLIVIFGSFHTVAAVLRQ